MNSATINVMSRLTLYTGSMNKSSLEITNTMDPKSRRIIAATFIKNFTEISQYNRFKSSNGGIIRKNNSNIQDERVVYADSTLFDVFSLNMIAGDKTTALKEPHSLVMNETAARKYFNSLDVIGKTILADSIDYKITGIVKDILRESNFTFDLFMPLCELEASRDNSWLNANLQTYLLLKPGTDFQDFEKRMNRSIDPLGKTEQPKLPVLQKGKRKGYK